MTEQEDETPPLFLSRLIASRQTILPKRLVEPGPDAQELEQLFIAASAAPDHDLINPWRFLVIALDKRSDLGELFARALGERDPSALTEQRSRRVTKPCVRLC